MTVATAGATLTGGRRTLGLWLTRGFALDFGRFAAPLEIGGIPATALELKPGRGQLLGKVFCLTRGAGGSHRVAHLVHDIFLKAALTAAISVDRHEIDRKSTRLNSSH